MFRPFDIAVKDLIQVFAKNIPVIGLQNDDTTDSSESVLSQVAKNSNEDKLSFPIISIFRNPEAEIIDASHTKRPSSVEGYSWDTENKAITLVTMRAKTSYTVDVFDVTRASAEEIALRLFFRLRNNPEVKATIDFPQAGHSEKCKAEIQLNPQILNARVNDKSKIQAYKIRFSFNLIGINLFDLISREWPELRYTITVEFDTKS